MQCFIVYCQSVAEDDGVGGGSVEGLQLLFNYRSDTLFVLKEYILWERKEGETKGGGGEGGRGGGGGK